MRRLRNTVKFTSRLALLAALVPAVWWGSPETNIPKGKFALVEANYTRLTMPGRAQNALNKALQPWSLKDGHFDAGTRTLPEDMAALVVIESERGPGDVSTQFEPLRSLPGTPAFNWSVEGATEKQAFLRVGSARLRVWRWLPVPTIHHNDQGWWITWWSYHGPVNLAVKASN